MHPGERHATGRAYSADFGSSIDLLRVCFAFESTSKTSGGPSVVAPANWRVYSISWSARSRSDFGMSILSALAVFRLITNSMRVPRSTGNSAGFAPLSIRFT